MNQNGFNSTMAQKKKPIWVQVAEAGFGDMLEKRGWQQVSPAHWKQQRDGVTWRTLLGKSPERGASPETCFEDSQGILLDGFEELYKEKLGHGSNLLFRMLRPSVKAHFVTNIPELFYRRERDKAYDEYKAVEATWSWWGHFVNWWRGTYPRDWPGLRDVEPVVHHDSKHSQPVGWWSVEGSSVEDVSQRLTEWWIELAEPYFEKYATAELMVQHTQFTETEDRMDYLDAVDIMANYLVGNIEYCRRRFDAIGSLDVVDGEERYAKWRSDRKFYKRMLRNSESHDELRATAFKFSEEDARTRKHLIDLRNKLNID